MTAYRDDLEAAQLRASDLERELNEMRARNKALEKRVEGVRDTEEALANARRLQTALEREQQELRERTAGFIEDRAEALLCARQRERQAELARRRRDVAGGAVMSMGMLAVLLTFAAQQIVLALVAIVVFIEIVVVIDRGGPTIAR
jgi:predicted RNase H-like nuclease (RuvC/YqgF family)